MSNKLDSLIEKYNGGVTVKERMISLKLQYIKELYGACGNSEEAHLFSEIVENFCEIIERMPPVDADMINSIPRAPYSSRRLKNFFFVFCSAIITKYCRPFTFT